MANQKETTKRDRQQQQRPQQQTRERSARNGGAGEMRHAANLGLKSLGEMGDRQREILDTFAQTTRDWVGRAAVETELVSDTMRKLGEASSIPDLVSTQMDFMMKRTQLMAEDTRHMISDMQRLLSMGSAFMIPGAQIGSQAARDMTQRMGQAGR